LSLMDVLPLLESHDSALARAAAVIAGKHQDWMAAVTAYFSAELQQGKVSPASLTLLEAAVKPWLAETSVAELVSVLAESSDAACRSSAWRILASASSAAPQLRCVAPLRNALATAAPADLPLLLDAIAKLDAPDLDKALNEFAADDKRALSLRLRALSARIRLDSPMEDTSCAMLLRVLGG